MEQNKYRKNCYDMIYLTTCAINGKTPEKARIDAMDFDTLFEVCQDHILTTCVAYALETVDICIHNFIQEKEKSIRKNIILDMDRQNILKRLEQEHIWYMPLKGSIIKDWYPKLGMRQMSDNDILFDSLERKHVKNIMLEMGFSCEHYGKGNDDAYFKPPVSNFEMHNQLFSPLTYGGKLSEYYDNVKTKLVKDDNNEFGWHFRMEDFYIYMITHTYKHYSESGTGIRSLMDIYIFLYKFKDVLDWDYIYTELQKLKITEYEQCSRELAMKLFEEKTLTEKETEELDYYIFSGTYGNAKNRMERSFERIGGGSKAKYIFRRFFPTMDDIKLQWNFFYRHKWLIPVLWLYRPVRSVLINGKGLKKEWKFLMGK